MIYVPGWDVFLDYKEVIYPKNSTHNYTHLTASIPSSMMPDYIHPSPFGARQWGLRIKAAIDEALDSR